MKIMELGNLKKYESIVIQMHDNPDADAMGCGYAFYRYFTSLNKKVRLVYGGKQKITKSNIRIMAEELGIPAEYLNDPDFSMEKPQLLLTVDCQYGEGNVQHVDADAVAMIDHHNTMRMSDEMCEIRSNLVSCASICYDMLKKEGFDFEEDVAVSTALYYGLYMDSNEFAEVRHPLEWDMIECLKVDRQIIYHVTHANFTLEEFETAGMAMLRYSYNEKKHLAIIKAKPCDPNILGLIGDFIIQVDTIDMCVVFNEFAEGYKLSVRSCQMDAFASDMVEFLTEGIGSGGGHLNKAGGFISKKKFTDQYGDMGIETYILSYSEKFYDSCIVVKTKEGIADTSGFELYQKRPDLVYGYVRTLDFLKAGDECKIRTLDGDVTVTASEKTYLMIGVLGEVYPIQREKFEQKYIDLGEKFEKNLEYEPSVIEANSARRYGLMPYARQCRRQEDAMIYARQLSIPAKVISDWKYDKYMYGGSGDYLCYSAEDPKDIYVIKRRPFDLTYMPKR